MNALRPPRAIPLHFLRPSLRCRHASTDRKFRPLVVAAPPPYTVRRESKGRSSFGRAKKPSSDKPPFRSNDRGSSFRSNDRDSSARSNDRGSSFRSNDRDSSARPNDRDSSFRSNDRESSARPNDHNSSFQSNDRYEKPSASSRRPLPNREISPEAVVPKVYRSPSGRMNSSEGFHHGRQDRYDPVEPIFTRQPRRELPRTHDDTEFLYGTSVIQAALLAKNREFYKLYIYTGENREDATRTRDLGMKRMAVSRGVEVVMESDIGLLDSMANSRPHNGYVLECSPLLQMPILHLTEVVDNVISYAKAQHAPGDRIRLNSITPTFNNRDPTRHPFLLMLDSISDTGNLGAIMRSAYFMGASGILISQRNCASVGPVALKASAGAAEFLPVFTYANPARLIQHSSERGWRFFAAVPPITKNQMRKGTYHRVEDDTVKESLDTAPTVLVMGAEAEGLRDQVKNVCGHRVSIGSGPDTKSLVDSLNVSVAAAVLCHGFLGRHSAKSKGGVAEEKKEARTEAKVESEEAEWEFLKAQREEEAKEREEKRKAKEAKEAKEDAESEEAAEDGVEVAEDGVEMAKDGAEGTPETETAEKVVPKVPDWEMRFN